MQAQQGSAELNLGVSHSLPPSGGTGTAASYLFGGGRIQQALGSVATLQARLHGGLAAETERGDWISGRAGLDLGSAATLGPGWGLELGAEGFAVAAPLPYRAATATAAPELRWKGEGWQLALRGFGAVGGSRVELSEDTSDFVPPPFRAAAPARQIPPGGPPDDGEDTGASERTADLWGVGGEAEIAVEAEPATLRLAALHRETGVGVYRAVRVAADGPAGRLRWSGNLALWDTPDGTEPVALLGLSVPLSAAVHAFAGGGRSRPNPVLGTPTVSEATAGMGWRIPFGSPATPLYHVRGSPGAGGGRTVALRLEAPDAERVVVLGDFTRWEPIELTRSDGAWRVTLSVEPGVYHFGFRVDGSWHVPDRARASVTDEWGRVNAVMVVPDGGTRNDEGSREP